LYIVLVGRRTPTTCVVPNKKSNNCPITSSFSFFLVLLLLRLLWLLGSRHRSAPSCRVAPRARAFFLDWTTNGSHQVVGRSVVVLLWLGSNKRADEEEQTSGCSWCESQQQRNNIPLRRRGRRAILSSPHFLLVLQATTFCCSCCCFLWWFTSNLLLRRLPLPLVGRALAAGDIIAPRAPLRPQDDNLLTLVLVVVTTRASLLVSFLLRLVRFLSLALSYHSSSPCAYYTSSSSSPLIARGVLVARSSWWCVYFPAIYNHNHRPPAATRHQDKLSTQPLIINRREKNHSISLLLRVCSYHWDRVFVVNKHVVVLSSYHHKKEGAHSKYCCYRLCKSSTSKGRRA
jgi:hypothetical protein